MRDYVERYFSTRDLEASTAQTYGYLLPHIARLDMTVSELKPADIQQWLLDLAEDGIGPSMTEKTFNQLKYALRYGVALEELPRNPCDSVKLVTYYSFAPKRTLLLLLSPDFEHEPQNRLNILRRFDFEFHAAAGTLKVVYIEGGAFAPALLEILFRKPIEVLCCQCVSAVCRNGNGLLDRIVRALKRLNFRSQICIGFYRFDEFPHVVGHHV